MHTAVQQRRGAQITILDQLPQVIIVACRRTTTPLCRLSPHCIQRTHISSGRGGKDATFAATHVTLPSSDEHTPDWIVACCQYVCFSRKMHDGPAFKPAGRSSDVAAATEQGPPVLQQKSAEVVLQKRGIFTNPAKKVMQAANHCAFVMSTAFINCLHSQSSDMLIIRSEGRLWLCRDDAVRASWLQRRCWRVRTYRPWTTDEGWHQ